MKSRLVALAGPPCSGKSTTGMILAGILGAEFIETDTEIEKTAGMSVSGIFKTRGESGFREIEKEVIFEVLSRCRNQKAVIALGGGSLLNTGAKADVSRRCWLFTLYASTEELVLRNSGGRPLVPDRQAFVDLLGARESHYSSLANPVDTTGRTPGEVAEIIAEMLRKEDRSRWFL